MRFAVVALLLVAVCAACADGGPDAAPGSAADGAASDALPHIVLIVPDDLGRHDVSFHGGEIATPHIDRIAAEGVLLERFYTAPICSPTRAGLMTGRYPIRYGLMRDVIAPWQDFGLDTEEVTLPEVLAAAGYEHRGVFGKWHLGHIRREHHPLRRGFTEFVGHNTSIDYFTKERFGERDWFHGYESVDEDGYVTDLVAEHAVRFIDRHADGEAPFFLYVPFNAAHSPLQAKEEDLPRYAHLDAVEPPRSWEEVTAGWPLAPEEERRESRRVHAAMVHALDEGVGRILRALDDRGIAENTLVLFFSDNGGGVGSADNGPYRGVKSTVFEGGTRVAAAARWPAGGVSGGGRVKAPVAYIDVLPTLMGIVGIAGIEDTPGGEEENSAVRTGALDGRNISHGAGREVRTARVQPAEASGRPAPPDLGRLIKELDGRDVREVLTGTDPDGPARDLYSFVGQKNPSREQVSVWSGDWKLVVIGPPLHRPGSVEESDQLLYRIEDDPFEERNLAAEHPDVAARLLDLAREFRGLQPPNAVSPFGVGPEGFQPPPNWQFPDADAAAAAEGL